MMLKMRGKLGFCGTDWLLTSTTTKRGFLGALESEKENRGICSSIVWSVNRRNKHRENSCDPGWPRVK
jgi:hypothetical protein